MSKVKAIFAQGISEDESERASAASHNMLNREMNRFLRLCMIGAVLGAFMLFS